MNAKRLFLPSIIISIIFQFYTRLNDSDGPYDWPQLPWWPSVRTGKEKNLWNPTANAMVFPHFCWMNSPYLRTNPAGALAAPVGGTQQQDPGGLAGSSPIQLHQELGLQAPCGVVLATGPAREHRIDFVLIRWSGWSWLVFEAKKWFRTYMFNLFRVI